MRIVCWQLILMKHHTLFFTKIGKYVTNLLSAAVLIGALMVNKQVQVHFVFRQIKNGWVYIVACERLLRL